MFDDYADHFEDKLVNALKYSVPVSIAQTASERSKSRGDEHTYHSVFDAGCGTGLMGPHLRKLVTTSGTIVGADLSPKMLALAAELVKSDGVILRRCAESARLALGHERLYDGVFVGDLLDLDNGVAPLEGFGHDMTVLPHSFDLVVSADVLCYFGDLGAVLDAFARRLAPGGDLIFSTETIKEGDYNWIMLPSERYAHEPGYVARIASGVGLELVSQDAFTPRMEAGEKVLGTMHVFHKPMQ
mmetsp:Transcript_39731/g.48393  ORF Transcript_39731/g.48393 Transcript_39731/m.48393 type:complete len:243 (+) Transcript_39731:213-941(+)